MATKSIPTIRVIAINAAGGALVTISASIFAGYVEIEECPPGGGAFVGSNYAPQGLNYSLPDDNYTLVYGLDARVIKQFGDAIRKNRSIGIKSITYPDGSVRAATPYGKFVSAQNATQVEVREWPQQ